MSKTISLQNRVLFVHSHGNQQFITVTSTSITLWDIKTMDSLKTILFPPGETIQLTASHTEGHLLSLYVYTTTQTSHIVHRFTHQTFDYTKSIQHHLDNKVTSMFATSNEVCHLFTSSPSTFHKIQFNTSPLHVETVPFKNAPTKFTIDTATNSLYHFNKQTFELMKRSLPSLQIINTVKLQPTSELISLHFHNNLHLIFNETHEIYSPRLQHVSTQDLRKEYDSITTSIISNEFILVSTPSKAVLHDLRYFAPVATYDPIFCAALSPSYLISSSPDGLTIFINQLPSRPTLASAISTPVTAPHSIIEVDVRGVVKSISKETRMPTLDEEKLMPKVLPSIDYEDDEEFNKVICDLSVDFSPLKYRLWDIIVERMKQKGCSVRPFFYLCIDDKYFEGINFVLSRNNIEIPDAQLLRIITTIIDADTSFFTDEMNKKQFLTHTLNREINSQTAPLMLSKLETSKVIYLFKFLIKLLDRADPQVSLRNIINWTMAIIDAHVTLMITDQQLMELVNTASDIVQKQILLTEGVEDLLPYLTQLTEKNQCTQRKFKRL
ncbi:Uncharacterized protein QTN25_006517 [Entamoeba marina]